MLRTPEPACLLIADISGYTSYLAGVELDHAQDVLGDLIGTVVGALRPMFRLVKLEGDAAFMALVGSVTVDGSSVQDAVEHCYFAFRRRLRDIVSSSACECDACVRIPALDLKAIVHHGMVVRQRIAGREELAGADVILVHRLLKNDVEAATGVRAYAAYTEACVVAMGFGEPSVLGLRRHVEEVEGIGPATVWIRDLAGAWAIEQDRARTRVTDAAAFLVIEDTFPVPAQVAFEYVTSPIRRPQWGRDVTEVREHNPAGRRAAGTTNHCMHGAEAVLEEILDWSPYDYRTTRVRLPMPGIPPLVMTDEFVPVEGGTRARTLIARPRAGRAALDRLRPMFADMIKAAYDELRPVLAAVAATAGTDPEPPGRTAAARPAAGVRPARP